MVFFMKKVISNLGLCASVYNIRSIEGGLIFPGHGAATYTVNFGFELFIAPLNWLQVFIFG